MANSGPNTNGSQFFVISGPDGTQLPPQYTLFGKVTEGLDTTIATIAALGQPDETPSEPVQILSVTITES
jgi:peptidylprolyl isomerase/peptidyl-prolyl cis-trans isomerase B (cyclophilin B)